MNHPNRSCAGSAARNPDPSDVLAFRESVQERLGLKITAAQTYCASLVHTTCRVWQQWEAGDRRMHPGFWLLARIQWHTRTCADRCEAPVPEFGGYVCPHCGSVP